MIVGKSATSQAGKKGAEGQGQKFMFYGANAKRFSRIFFFVGQP